MTKFVNVVCLVNSRRWGGYCFAGKELDKYETNSWIRPVASEETGELSSSIQRYECGEKPSLLDVVRLPLKKQQKRNTVGFQTENWILDLSEKWKKVGEIEFNQVNKYVDDTGGVLWFNMKDGKNDKVPINEAESISNSIYLIEVSKLHVTVYYDFRGRKKCRAKFEYRDNSYNLKVTDPEIEKKYKSMGIGDHKLKKCFVTVSLLSEFRGYCYKLAASIIEA